MATETIVSPTLTMDEEAVYRARQAGDILKLGQRFRVIDLIAGAGGMSLGFSSVFGHPFTPVWANDFNEYASETFNENFGHVCVTGDIVDLLNDPSVEIPEADVVIGGPPCQGFSLLNRNRDGDLRNQLWRPFLEVVKRSRAEVFVMENVPQLLGSDEHRQIINAAESLGFKLAWSKLCAADYGVPQTRHRAVIIGCRFADPSDVFPPRRTHYDPGKGQMSLWEYLPDAGPWQTVRDAISDLPAPEDTEIRAEEPPLDLHFGRNPTKKSLLRYKAIPEESYNHLYRLPR